MEAPGHGSFLELKTFFERSLPGYLLRLLEQGRPIKVKLWAAFEKNSQKYWPFGTLFVQKYRKPTEFQNSFGLRLGF
jgi:hypothetical protein